MDKEKKDLMEVLTILVENIRNDIHLDCVILFGSRARDDFMPNSDLDIIFIGEFKNPFINRSEIIYKHLNFKLGLDAFCYMPNEFRKLFLEGIVSILDAIDHGICLYGFDFYVEYKERLEILKSRGLKRDPPVWILPANMSFE